MAGTVHVHGIAFFRVGCAEVLFCLSAIFLQ
jgi:hypothetical protein